MKEVETKDSLTGVGRNVEIWPKYGDKSTKGKYSLSDSDLIRWRNEGEEIRETTVYIGFTFL